MHNFTGTLIGMVHIMLPFLVLPLYATMRAIDRDYMQRRGEPRRQPGRARSGTSSCRCRCRASSPAALIVFILCLGFYVTPAVLGGGKVIMSRSQISQRHRALLQLGRGERARRRAAGR